MSTRPHPSEDPRPQHSPIRVFRLGAEPGDDLTDCTTPEQRVALVWELSRRLWALTGVDASPPPRQRLPIRITRPT